ncbi:MAG: YlbF family regulator [Clostridia bacterium]|nr:YlbF family regulator [Clostridia bacterium]
MGELKTYLTLLNDLRSDKALMQIIDEYEYTTKQLSALLQNPDYDPAEAIRLTNDAEYLSAIIASNPKYNAYMTARKQFEASVAAKIQHTGIPGCNCAMCKNASKRKKFEEES